jgi:hypothetical protein
MNKTTIAFVVGYLLMTVAEIAIERSWGHAALPRSRPA